MTFPANRPGNREQRERIRQRTKEWKKERNSVTEECANNHCFHVVTVMASLTNLFICTNVTYFYHMSTHTKRCRSSALFFSCCFQSLPPIRPSLSLYFDVWHYLIALYVWLSLCASVCVWIFKCGYVCFFCLADVKHIMIYLDARRIHWTAFSASQVYSFRMRKNSSLNILNSFQNILFWDTSYTPTDFYTIQN